MTILTCDPGVTGAFARRMCGTVLIDDMLVNQVPNARGGKRSVPDRDAIIDFLRTQHMLGCEILLIEHVWGYEGQGGGAAFNFGHGAGGIEYAAAAIGYRVEKVAAITWKSALKVPSEKKRAIDRATELLPAYVNRWAAVRGNGSEALRSGRAEAALLLLYGEQTLGALPNG